MKTLLWLTCFAVLARTSIQDLVASTGPPPLPSIDDQPSPSPSTTEAPKLQKPEMYSMHVDSRIAHRYAKTTVVSRIANPAPKAQEVFFSMVLPETAFIAGFNLEVDGKVYEAYVKEKEEAKEEYDQAVASGQTAAHVGVSARDSNTFTVSVNVEPSHKVTFNLTYEELLTRRLGEYSQVINLNPGQLVRDMQVDIYIKETRNLTTLRVPEFRTGNEIDAHEENTTNSLATIKRTSATEAHVHFAPSIEQQQEIAAKKKDKEEDQENKDADKGLGGQFVVQYDVDREPQGGEVLVNEGYFVHFFAPSELPPLHKHVVFVLDVSGSMEGRKVEQLKEAMIIILNDLNPGDYFNILEFSYSVTVWNLDSASANLVYSPYSSNKNETGLGVVPAFPATPEYIKKAKDVISKMTAGGGTNIHDALKTAINVVHTGLQNVTATESKPEPIIVFLTDGEPTVGETRPQKLHAMVSEMNENPSAAIFSLAFGDDADFGFLKKLSLRNSGFARKIYEAADATLQLRDFYKQVASPLLSNVTFKYDPDKVDSTTVTRKMFPIFFLGSECVVAGRLSDKEGSDITGEVSGQAVSGDSSFPVDHIRVIPDIKYFVTNRSVSSLEKLWAYLTIQQLLEEEEANSEDKHFLSSDDGKNKTEAELEAKKKFEEAKKKALELALQYSFVTRLTSLVVVKPNETSSAGLETTKPGATSGSRGPGGVAFARPASAIFANGVSFYSLSDPLAQAPPSFRPRPGYPLMLMNKFSQSGSFPSFVQPEPEEELAVQSTTYDAITEISPMGGALQSSGIPLLIGGQVPSPSNSAYPRPPGAGGFAGGPPGFFPSTTVHPHYHTTNKPASSTTQVAESSSISETLHLVSLNDLEWLAEASNGTDNVSIPLANGTEIFKLGLSENNIQGEECSFPDASLTGTSHCRHLSHCVLTSIVSDVHEYAKYFCHIGEYAGVCCPDELQQQSVTQSSISVMPSSTTSPAA
ncbi:inter-alpha-trypsin inhibitor heavy chain H4 isoform X2 [Anabrus simplex]|uniref:inter-alpha-trypsin inhibitor heavy chain H4 isoform X2 n=1 Tax=Anabrus simplex TaxID=316456 RepID=UPI0035A28DC9